MGSSTFSSAVRVGIRWYDWKTKPILRPRTSAIWSSVRRVMSSPSRITWPVVGESSPASRPSRVLLPLPDGPMMAANCPRGISRSMPLRISTRCVPVSMDLVRARTWINPYYGIQMRMLCLLTLIGLAGCERSGPYAAARALAGTRKESARAGSRGRHAPRHRQSSATASARDSAWIRDRVFPTCLQQDLDG